MAIWVLLILVLVGQASKFRESAAVAGELKGKNKTIPKGGLLNKEDRYRALADRNFFSFRLACCKWFVLGLHFLVLFCASRNREPFFLFASASPRERRREEEALSLLLFLLLKPLAGTGFLSEIVLSLVVLEEKKKGMEVLL